MQLDMLLHELVIASDAVAATSARSAKIAALAEVLGRAEGGEVPAAVAFLSGALLQRQIGVGWATLREVAGGAVEPSLTVGDVAAAFEAIGALAGPGSQAARREAVGALYARATAAEGAWLTRLMAGDLGQGALGGVMVEAVARAAGLRAAEVRRALMLDGDLPRIAALALGGGAAALAEVRLQVGRPVHPMLASPAAGLEAAFGRVSPAAVEVKLDGARIQVHRSGGDVGVFTRSLDDVTARVPEVVAAALALPASAVVLDGEAIALRSDGRPHPFQVTASRFGSRGRTDVPLTGLFFDVLHVDGEDLLERPGGERAAALEALVPEAGRVPRVVAEDEQQGEMALEAALARGHEGVVVKALDAPYLAGRRGSGWLKVKPVHTLDLVVLGVEWGSGRRRAWLSNLHLGARADERSEAVVSPKGETGGFVMLG